MKTRIARDVATARRPGRPIPAAMGTAGWAQAEADRARIRSVLRAPPDWRAPATTSVPASTTKHDALSAAPAADQVMRIQFEPLSLAPRLFGSIQPKLKIGTANDPLEYEADRVADHVMHMPAPSASAAAASPQANRKCDTSEEAAEKFQRKLAGPQAATGETPTLVHEVLRSPGQPLDTAAREFFEPRFGHDFSRVRVHTDARAADTAKSINAKAFTVGRDIAFGAGQYAPKSHEGQRLLAHELTHVVQQDGEHVQRAGTQSLVQRDKDDAKPRRSHRRTPKR